MRPFKFLVPATLLALSALRAAPSQAQPEPATTPSTPAAHEDSRQYYKAGNEAFLSGDKKSARAHYLRALELEKQWDILCNLGRVEGEMGLDAEALEHLDECLKEYPPSADKRVQAARAKFFDLRVEIRDRCRRMSCDYKEPPVSSGLEATPVVAAPVEAPAAAVEPSPTTVDATVSHKEPAEVHKSSAKWPVVITTGALGVVGLGLGVGFHVLAEDKSSRALALEDELANAGVRCEIGAIAPCHEYQETKQAFFDARTAETISFIAGGTLATAAVVLAIVWPDKVRPSAARGVQPLVAIEPGGTFLGLAGQF